MHSGTLDKEEFVRMMYEFIQNREPASTEEEEEDDTDQSKPPGPEDDGTYPPTDGVVSVSVISCADLLAADSNGLSDPYIKLKMGANGNERKTRVMAKTLNPVFAQTFQLKLRRFTSRVGDQILWCVARSFAVTSLLPQTLAGSGPTVDICFATFKRLHSTQVHSI